MADRRWAATIFRDYYFARAEQYGLTAPGWESAAGSYGETGSYRSVADIVDASSLTKVREFKKAAKAAAKEK